MSNKFKYGKGWLLKYNRTCRADQEIHSNMKVTDNKKQKKCNVSFIIFFKWTKSITVFWNTAIKIN